MVYGIVERHSGTIDIQSEVGQGHDDVVIRLPLAAQGRGLRRRARTMAADVHIWWIGADAADDRLMETVRAARPRPFGIHARPYRHADRPHHAFDPRRGQHSSTAILKWLVGRDHPGRRMLAITDADLFIPVLTFVYGEAQLGRPGGGRVDGAAVRSSRAGGTIPRW